MLLRYIEAVERVAKFCRQNTRSDLDKCLGYDDPAPDIHPFRMDAAREAIKRLHRDLTARIRHSDFICPFGWPESFHAGIVHLWKSPCGLEDGPFDPMFWVEQGEIKGKPYRRFDPNGFTESWLTVMTERFDALVASIVEGIAETEPETLTSFAEPITPPLSAEPIEPSEAPATPSPVDFTAIIAEFLARRPKAWIVPARFVEYMADKTMAPREDVEDYVYGHDHGRTPGALGKIIRRINEHFVDKGLPLSFRPTPTHVMRLAAPDWTKDP